MTIDTAVFLAAGKGERMMPLTKDRPKCLLDFSGLSILKKTIYQLINCGIKSIIVVVGYCKEAVIADLENIRGVEITVVRNEKYDEDVNIYSLLLALEHVSDPFLLIEADTIFEDDLIAYLTSDGFEGKSVWFTKGPFTEVQYGGILKADDQGNIIDIRIVPEFEERYRGYKKLTGIMRVARAQLDLFKDLLTRYAAETIQQYYLVPWIENLASLPAVEADISAYDFATFNRPEEYLDVIKHRTFLSEYRGNGIHLIDVNKLKHIEGFSSRKVEKLAEKILGDDRWTRPICVEKNHWLVLDGQHRLEAAKRLGVKYIPSMLFNYCDVKFWSLRDNHDVSIELVCDKALSGDIYPYKTVKHDFIIPVQLCDFPISKLT